MEDFKMWELVLVTDKYIFYKHLEETDENANTKMYNRKMEILADNYFATSAFVDEMYMIAGGKTDVSYMSPSCLFYLEEIRKENKYGSNDQNTTRNYQCI